MAKVSVQAAAQIKRMPGCIARGRTRLVAVRGRAGTSSATSATSAAVCALVRRLQTPWRWSAAKRGLTDASMKAEPPLRGCLAGHGLPSDQ